METSVPTCRYIDGSSPSDQIIMYGEPYREGVEMITTEQ